MAISYAPTDTKDATLRRARAGQWLTIFHGLFEGCGSLIAASTAGSVALVSFGLDSMIEVLSATIVLFRLASIQRSGRFALSDRAGLRAVGICFLILAVDIAQESYFGIARHEQPKASILGIVVALISILMMPILARAKRRWADEVGSEALRADSRQTDFCAYLAAITLFGLACNAVFGWWWADPVAALVMTPVIAWEGVQALRGHACGCCACSV